MATRKRAATWRPAVAELVRRRMMFQQLVADALDELPEQFRSRLDNVEVVLEDSAGRLSPLGLYTGIPHTERDSGYGGVLPDVITIYRLPLETRARTEKELADQVRITVLHEIAHHFGISDERLRELGYE